MCVYLIHFENPIPRGTSRRGTPLVAGHYLGYTNDLNQRIDAHHSGNGARLMEVITQRGIGWTLVRTWPDADRQFERRLKNQKNTPRLCPLCREAALARRRTYSRRTP